MIHRMTVKARSFLSPLIYLYRAVDKLKGFAQLRTLVKYKQRNKKMLLLLQPPNLHLFIVVLSVHHQLLTPLMQYEGSFEQIKVSVSSSSSSSSCCMIIWMTHFSYPSYNQASPVNTISNGLTSSLDCWMFVDLLRYLVYGKVKSSRTGIIHYEKISPWEWRS